MKLPKLNTTKSFPLQAQETIVQNITSLPKLGPIFFGMSASSCHVKDANQHPVVSTVDFHPKPI